MIESAAVPTAHEVSAEAGADLGTQDEPTVREVIRLLAAFATPTGRREAAQRLARHVDADAVFVFVLDAETPGLLLPAPGFPQTLPGGPSWRAFLRVCRTPGVHRGEVAYPTAGALTPVLACVDAEGTALVFLGGHGSDAAIGAIRLALPLVGAVLRAEQRAIVAAGQATVAREATQQARTLANALDAVRAEVAQELVEAGRRNHELQQEQAVRERLLGIVGHDLRTPLNAIGLATEVLLGGGSLVGEDARVVALIARSADRMGRMIHQLLDFTRARFGGELPVERVKTDLDGLSRDIIAELELSSPACVLRYQSLGDCVAECDPDRWCKVVSNLGANAIKYGSPGRPIDVTLHEEGAALVLTVHNEGPPIAAEALPFLFEPFWRGQADHSCTAESLGLGLYIVHETIRTHGGTIDVRSTAADGTTFTVRLPRSAVRAAPVPPTPTVT